MTVLTMEVIKWTVLVFVAISGQSSLGKASMLVTVILFIILGTLRRLTDMQP